jgi:hypothetical protein
MVTYNMEKIGFSYEFELWKVSFETWLLHELKLIQIALTTFFVQFVQNDVNKR